MTLGSNFLERLKQIFWEEKSGPGRGVGNFNYPRMWKLAVLLTSTVALIPLIFITVADYKVTQNSIESGFLLRTSRVVSNTRRSISFFLDERRSALDFIVLNNNLKILSDTTRLSEILNHLQESFGGGFMDIGVIDHTGKQHSYAGPFGLKNKDYSTHSWFKKVVEKGVYVSDVFLGYRKIPHLVIAVRRPLDNHKFYVLRAAISLDILEALLFNLELDGLGDAFIINHKGVLQTASRYHGKVLQKLSLPIPGFSDTTQVLENKNNKGEKLVIGYRFIDGTPFILMVVKKKHELMKPWYATRTQLITFLLISVTIILAVILGMVTYMVSNIYMADSKRLMILHQIEYANKMATIGRMAASVAHEINNPLAIINEKAGLIKDLFALKKVYAGDTQLEGLLSSIISSVKRAGKITKRLLTFSRNLEASIEIIDLKELIVEVLSFQEKEAEYRGLTIKMDIPEEMPSICSDRGKLEQIFLNIINNAFAAVDDDGWLDIQAFQKGKDLVSIRFSDNGCGIPDKDLKRIFEPFYSTKTKMGGTGLGLSITYNLTQEIGGVLSVDSEMGKGSRFTVILPLNAKLPKEDNDANTTC